MSDYLFGRMAADSLPARVLYWIVPNWQHFWRVDALTGGGTIPWVYMAFTGLYAAVYAAAVLCVGVVSFKHAEIT
jgi:hypothetical protein